MQFQEDFLGKNSQKPLMTRIPVRYFLDFKPGGGLCHLLLAAYRFKCEHGWRKFELPTGKVCLSGFIWFVELFYLNNEYRKTTYVKITLSLS